jgi:hypothetical protein
VDDVELLAGLVALGSAGPPQDVVLGDVRVRVHGLAEELAWTAAHLLDAPSGEPVATLHHVTGTAPPPPWAGEDCLVRDQVRGRTTGRFRALYRPDVPALSFADLDTATGVLWHRSARLPASETCAPFAPLLSWLLAGSGLRMTHGAVVGHEEGAVLLAGPGGAGKTTTVLAGLRGGLLTTGEDYVLVDLADRVALATYDVAKLGAHPLAWFPEAAPHVRATAEQGKAVAALSDVFPDRFAARLPLRAIVVPRVAERTGERPLPVSPMVALRALSAGTLVQLAGDDDRVLRQLGELVRSLPCYTLDVGPDLDAIAPALARVLPDRSRAA